MKDLKASIIESLDGEANLELLPYLPYILQDLTEIGTDPRLIEKLVRTHIGLPPLKILDLGCGKGAVSIHLAREMGCELTGIDGMEEFIASAKKLAEKNKVGHLCRFVQGDIRVEIEKYKNFDLVVLGAIGPVFGFVGDTLKAISPALKPNSWVIIDDGFKEDNTLPDYDRVISRSEFYSQIAGQNYTLVEEIILRPDDISESNNYIQDFIVKRCGELSRLHPEKASVFNSYIQAQEKEIEMMESRLHVGIWLLRKNW